MENGVLYNGLLALPIIEIIEVTRMIFGPLHFSICWFQSLWRNGPTHGAMLHLNAIVIFRVLFLIKSNASAELWLPLVKSLLLIMAFFQYMYIFVFGGYIGLDEVFFARFCSMAIVMIWLMYGLVYMHIPGKMGINYYMCTGQDPRVDIHSHKKVSTKLTMSRTNEPTTDSSSPRSFLSMSSFLQPLFASMPSFTYGKLFINGNILRQFQIRHQWILQQSTNLPLLTSPYL